MDRLIEYFSNKENCAKVARMSSYMGVASSVVGIATSIIKIKKKKQGENVSQLLKIVNVICTILAVMGAAVGSLLLTKMDE